jgi:hypothetical protein
MVMSVTTPTDSDRTRRCSHPHEVLEFEHGVRADAPSQPGAYWRLRWEEPHRQRERTAKGRNAAIAKATEIVKRLACGTRHRPGQRAGH